MVLKLYLSNLFLTILLLSIFTCCTTTNTIISEPLGAEVYIDDELVGKTPFTYKKKWSSSQTIKLLVDNPESGKINFPKIMDNISKEKALSKIEKLFREGYITKNDYEKAKKKLKYKASKIPGY